MVEIRKPIEIIGKQASTDESATKTQTTSWDSFKAILLGEVNV